MSFLIILIFENICKIIFNESATYASNYTDFVVEYKISYTDGNVCRQINTIFAYYGTFFCPMRLTLTSKKALVVWLLFFPELTSK